MKLRFTQLLTLFGFSLLLSLISSFWTVTRAQSPDPSSILFSPLLVECVPEMKEVKDRQVIAYTQSGGTSYYTILANAARLKAVFSQTEAEAEGGLPESGTPTQAPKPIREVTISVDIANQCQALVPWQSETFRPLTDLMPEDAARQLTLQKFQFDANLRGGVNELQKGLDETSESYRQGTGEGRILQPYEVWAYDQLGLKVPDNIPVAKPGDVLPDQMPLQPTPEQPTPEQPTVGQ